ncbi:MAG: hypothetical protein WC248_03670 [Candidatus Methanomethylophilaceae archaeon]|jgi:hypothetical protein
MRIGINRNKATVEFKDLSFEISIVPIFAEFLIAEHDKKDKEFSAVKEPSENEAREYSHTAIESLLGIVESILLANGYKYDDDFWKKNADTKALIEFIADCKMKDFRLDKKKVQEEK